MVTSTYPIDADNAAEPIDTRPVADMPAEFRALKTKVNTIEAEVDGYIAYFNVLTAFGAVGDGITDSQTAIEDAVAYCQSSGNPLYWPDGLFISTATVPGFHSIQHKGTGAIKRGTDTFYPDPDVSQANKLYLSPAGNDANDGLTAAQPMSTMQAVLNYLKNYGPVLKGSWTIQLAAGTYNAAAQLASLRSINDVVIRGPSVGGHPNAPTAIIDGTGVVSNSVGWYFQFYMKLAIHDVKFQNWVSVVGDAYGLCVDGMCQLYMNNCHFYNCRYAGVSIDNLSQVRMQGGIVDGCLFSGVRLYSQVSASIGYNGSLTGDSTEIKNCGVGISGRVSSRVHVDYANIHNCDTGIVAEYNTRCVVNYTKVQNNNIGWYATLTADIHTSYNGSNLMTGNGQNFICYSSVLSASTANECNYSTYWDETTKRWLYGSSSYRTPNAKFEWQVGSSYSGASYNSGVKAIFDFTDSVAYLGLSGPVGATVGLNISCNGSSAAGNFNYNMTSNYWSLYVNGAETFRLQATQFVPMVDNTITLGNGTLRWGTIYSGTGTINTSDERAKRDIEMPSEVEVKVARKVRNLLRKYRFKDAVAEKGASARIHFGVIAQDVIKAFESEGLNAFDYAAVCFDEWEEQPEVVNEAGLVTQAYVAAGNRYGVRYDELLVFMLSSI